jgi:LytS/YehU family sensor histidine kinase
MGIGAFSKPRMKEKADRKVLLPPPPGKFGAELFLPFRGLRNLTSCFLFLAIGTSIRVTEQWYSNEESRKEMENQKLTAELSFLKSQINPHFFFNTLNSIYSLAISKSDKTPVAIIKLSELMRFIIYDSEKEFVPLKREIDYINNYVELQRLRLMSNIQVNYRIEGDCNDKKIEPLILLPFIENAFKHGIDATKQCEIVIKIKISGRDLTLIVENPIVTPGNIVSRDSDGIGLANSKKRLELLYGINHKLDIFQANDIFRVELNIKFKDNELHNS